MKRTPLKRLGKYGKINLAANKILRKIFQEKGIDYCEAKLQGCMGRFGLSFAHKFKRYYYRDCPEKLSDFNHCILVCANCHSELEKDSELTQKIFNKLRCQNYENWNTHNFIRI